MIKFLSFFRPWQDKFVKYAIKLFLPVNAYAVLFKTAYNL